MLKVVVGLLQQPLEGGVGHAESFAESCLGPFQFRAPLEFFEGLEGFWAYIGEREHIGYHRESRDRSWIALLDGFEGGCRNRSRVVGVFAHTLFKDTSFLLSKFREMHAKYGSNRGKNHGCCNSL